jgi:hypothetical protein
MDGRRELLVPVTHYENGQIQMVYKSLFESPLNHFTGDFEAFIQDYTRPDARETFEGAALIKARAIQAREAIQLVVWALSDEAQMKLKPAIEFLMALEHASEPYLTEEAKHKKMAVPPLFPGRSCLDVATPEMVTQLLSIADQASYQIMARCVKSYTDGDGEEYGTIEEAINATWGVKCCCGILYRFSDSYDNYYDIEFSYASQREGISREVTCYNWEYQHPQIALAVAIDSPKEPELRYFDDPDDPASPVKSLERSLVQDVITILTLIRDDEVEQLHSVYKSYV